MNKDLPGRLEGFIIFYFLAEKTTNPTVFVLYYGCMEIFEMKWSDDFMGEKFTGKTAEFQKNGAGSQGENLVDSVVTKAENLYQAGKKAYENTPAAEEKRRKKIMAKIRDYGSELFVFGTVICVVSGVATLTGATLFLGGVAVSLGFFGLGMGQKKQGKRMMAYWQVMQNLDRCEITRLGTMTNVETNQVYRDLQVMLEKELLKEGFLDRANGLIVLKDVEQYIQTYQLPTVEPELPPEEAKIFADIREINQKIKNPRVSQQIDHVGDITGKIMAFEGGNTGQKKELQRFLSYYLPTTLKLLGSYSQLEAQNIQGENISKSMQEIEGMMDKVVEGFEKQLDQLFQSETMDIASDIAVLEQMFQKDGLSGNVLKMDKKPSPNGTGDIQLKL